MGEQLNHRVDIIKTAAQIRVFLPHLYSSCRVFKEITFNSVNLLREHGQDMGNSLHGYSRSLAALHGPHPTLVQEVT